MTNALAKLDKATQMLSEAKTLDEVKSIVDIAEAARVYARAAKLGLEAYNHAAEIKTRAERKAGEMLKQLDHGEEGRPSKLYQADKVSPFKEIIKENNIPIATAYRWQQVSNMPELVFERHLEDMRGEKPITTSGILKKMNGNGHKASVTYNNQPAIQETHGAVPLAGNSHVYTVNKLLWPEEVENLIRDLLIGRSLHLCCGKSQIGTVRLDLNEPSADIQADAAHTGLDNKEFDTVFADPPYNGNFQWNHDLLEEMARLAKQRIIFQHWFIPANPDGLYKKNNNFHLSNIFVWQPKTYFGRAQLISIFDWSSL
jgi:hypothetical protein